MAFKDVMRFLYERAKRQDSTMTQEKFARKHQIPRSEFNQILSGAYRPTPKMIGAILKQEGYNLEDCLELSDLRSARENYLQIAEQLLKDETLGDGLREYLDFLNFKREEAAGHRKVMETATRAPPAVRKSRRAM